MPGLTTNKDVNRVLREAMDRGWVAVRRRKHHLLRHPGGGRVSVPISPSDHRAAANLSAQLLRSEAQGRR